jgi:hypothetical protein
MGPPPSGGNQAETSHQNQSGSSNGISLGHAQWALVGRYVKYTPAQGCLNLNLTQFATLLLLAGE